MLDGGLEESVRHVNLNLLVPSAYVVVLPVMIAYPGGTESEHKQILYTCPKNKDMVCSIHSGCILSYKTSN